MAKGLDSYPEVMNAKMVAEYLDIGYVKALSLLKSGSIPCVRIGNAYKTTRIAVESWLHVPGYREILKT
ncbi:hypothetical protein N752_25160 [Desulforamulus aquiferis]|nr:helix-turn-helix domain-containing protein [Desulforamulus aquiferis]RYD02620.1 hypothetical protein N752_25160 [Desulforamulus aquiferis]